MKKSKGKNSAKRRALVERAVDEGRVKFMVRGENEGWTAIDADRESLEYLGNALLALASDEAGSSLTFDSPGPFFHPGSHGLIFYRVEKAADEGRGKFLVRDENEDWTAIDADRESLEYLGNALLALAFDEAECSLTIDSPGPTFDPTRDRLIFYRTDHLLEAEINPH